MHLIHAQLFKEHLVLLVLSSRCSVHSMKQFLHVRVSLFSLYIHTVFHPSSSMPLRNVQSWVMNYIFHISPFIHSFFLGWLFHLLFWVQPSRTSIDSHVIYTVQALKTIHTVIISSYVITYEMSVRKVNFLPGLYKNEQINYIMLNQISSWTYLECILWP